MYCPQCATLNSGDVKFCRSCGTSLEQVALALSGKRSKPDKTRKSKSEFNEQDWLEKRIEGVGGITRGSILLSVSLLLALPLGLFVPASFDAPWILLWVVFFGWMAVWGGIDIASGISTVLESRGRRHLIRTTHKESISAATTQDLLSEKESLSTPKIASSPVSVTEGTTRHLNE